MNLKKKKGIGEYFIILFLLIKCQLDLGVINNVKKKEKKVSVSILVFYFY